MTSEARVPRCPWCGGPVMTDRKRRDGNPTCHSCGRTYELGYLMEWMPAPTGEDAAQKTENS